MRRRLRQLCRHEMGERGCTAPSLLCQQQRSLSPMSAIAGSRRWADAAVSLSSLRRQGRARAVPPQNLTRSRFCSLATRRAPLVHAALFSSPPQGCDESLAGNVPPPEQVSASRERQRVAEWLELALCGTAGMAGALPVFQHEADILLHPVHTLILSGCGAGEPQHGPCRARSASGLPDKRKHQRSRALRPGCPRTRPNSVPPPWLRE